MHSLNITEKQLDDVTIVSLKGRLDNVTYIDFADKGLLLLEEGKKTIIFDFKNIEYISSGGMRAVLQIFKHAKQLSATVCITDLTPSVRDIMTITGFILYLKTYKDVDSALKELRHS